MQASTLAFALYELAKRPDFQAELRAEILDNLEKSQSGDMQYEAMPLLNALIKVDPPRHSL